MLHHAPIRSLLLPGLLLLAAGSRGQSAVRYVDGDFQGENPSGTSWLSAFADVQQAIDAVAAAGGGEVWVKAGIHRPKPNAERTGFLLKPGVALYGGFRGGETERDTRNPKANRTVLSGDTGRIGNDDDNARHVLVGASHCRIDGFTLSRGNAGGMEATANGGGLQLPAGCTDVVVAGCIFEKSIAKVGGGIAVIDAQVMLTNCTFYANTANYGGALAMEGKAVVDVVDSIFTSNFAPAAGGAAMVNAGATASFAGCTFLYNATDGEGGAIAAERLGQSPVSLKIADCTFNENRARTAGGAVAVSGPVRPVVTASGFTGNLATSGAGAISLRSGAKATLADCTFLHNRGTQGEENVGADAASQLVDATGNAELLAQALAPSPQQPPPGERPEPAKEARRMLPDVYVHTAQEIKVKLRSVVAGNPFTVVALGDLTDPAFIKHYRTVEAASIDCQDKVGFIYLYRALTHPGNNGFVPPFTQKERAYHAVLAARLLHTRIPWYCDDLDNQALRALAPDGKDSLFIIASGGEVLYAGPAANTAGFLNALGKVGGKNVRKTNPNSLPAAEIAPTSLRQPVHAKPPRTGPGIEFLPLQITPLDSKLPYYVKLRAEGDASLLKNGSGFIRLIFSIDPIYRTQWNNLGEGLGYAMKPSTGAVAPSVGKAPRITAVATDDEPREFLLDARKLDLSRPIPLQVDYSVHSTEGRRNIEVSQQYLVYLEHDLFGGTLLAKPAAGK